MSGDGLLPPGNNPPAPAGTPRSIVCEYCACVLAPDGSYVSMSDRARELRDQGEKLADVRKQIADVQAQLETANTALRAAQAEIATLKESPRRGGLFD